MGRSFSAICNSCETRFEVNEGSGMIAMPLRCDRCGSEWWWEFGDSGPLGEPNPPACPCGGSFTQEAPPRCLECRSTDLRHDPDGFEIIYD